MLAKGTILGNTWRIEKYLGEGACAKVYTVTPVGKPVDYEIVAKVIPTGNGGKSKKDKEQEKLCNTLYYEYVLYTGLLSDFPYKAQLPLKFSGIDEEKKLRYLVMEKFDFDLRELVKSTTVTPSKVANIGSQLLNGLQWLHQKGFVYVDVKPDNFMMKGNNVFFVDFGLVERVGSTQKGAERSFAGTPTYCSLGLNRGGEPKAKDDIEALGYVLLSLFNGCVLPWEQTSSDNELLSVKTNTNIRDLAKSWHCDELGDFITEARNGNADYEHYQQILRKLATRAPGATPAAKKKRNSKGDAKEVLPTEIVDESDLKKTLKKTKTLSLGEQKEHTQKKLSSAAATFKSTSLLKPAAVAPAPNTRAKRSRAEVEVIDLLEHDESETETVEMELPVSQPIKGSLKQPRLSNSSNANIHSPGPFSGKSLNSSSSRLSKSTEEKNPAKKENIPNLFVSKKVDSSESKKAADQSFQLLVTKGPHTDACFPLEFSEKLKNKGDEEESVVHLGREEGNHIIFSGDLTVSSRHLTIKKNNEGLFIKDNGSTNKTRINDERIYSRRWFPVQPNDRIAVGETEFQIISN